MAEWRTAAALAEHLGVPLTRVNVAVSITGLRDSKHHSRGEGSAQEYSPAAQGLVTRELKSRGDLNKARLRQRQVERGPAIMAKLEADREK